LSSFATKSLWSQYKNDDEGGKYYGVLPLGRQYPDSKLLEKTERDSTQGCAADASDSPDDCSHNAEEKSLKAHDWCETEV
jgi:hypothetical protein